jgi:hypothetical protein
MSKSFRFAKRVLVAAGCGWVLAWVVTVLICHAQFAAGGYTREALVELAPYAVWLIGSAGALGGIGVALFAGNRGVPPVVGSMACGVLVGVGVAVTMTLIVASSLGWPWNKGPQGQILDYGLAFGVPCGVIAGGVGGSVAWSRKRKRDAATQGQRGE